MARRHWPWDVLGIDRTADKAAIRSAYAVQLKAMDVDRDIQGFAALRSARDQALRDAASAREGDADDPLLDDEPEVPEATVAPEEGEGAFVYAAPEGWETDFNPGTAEAWGEDDFGYGTGDYVDPHSRVEYPDRVPDDDAPDRRLAQLLYPGGAQSDEAVTFEENEAAQAALGALLAEAKSADLGREQAVDYWLAEVLAESWPRSGPLVEQAAQAFDWVAQSGEIGERPALQFLNPRIRGLRFVAKVEQPDHPFHQYWEELKRPGRRGFVDRFRIKREGIENLLGGIRSRYPEVESYLDHERVASWEKPAPSWIAWAVQRVFIGIILIQAVALCSRALDDDGLPPAEVDRVVAEAFGPGRTMAEVQAADPDLADIVSNTIDGGSDAGEPVSEISQRVVKRLRGLTAIAAQEAPKDDLLAILAVRRDLLSLAAGQGTTACVELLELGGVPDTVVVTQMVRDKERALVWRLATAGLLSSEWKASDTRKLPLPPWVGPGVAERTRLPADRINAVLQGERTEDLCGVRIALIDTVLSRPDGAPVELLRIL